VPGAQHRRLDVLEVIGGVDDEGELVSTRHPPARLAWSQQPIVAHADAFSEVVGNRTLLSTKRFAT
jgi:hypothetical protein